ncbi:MAG: hypothetical protein M3040_09590, partial [Bacteroidota bacterium]|nr:hypothetical protein [Bacteroidota bacterium]
MKISTRLVFLLLFASFFVKSVAQTVLNTETFPNAFNLGYTTPLNTGFMEGLGKWIDYTYDTRSVIAVDNKKYASAPFALRISNSSTINAADESTCRATGPNVNCTLPCVTSASIQFKIFNANVNPANNFFYLFVMISKDNGASFTTLVKKSAAELVSAYGSNKWSNVTIPVPSEFNNTTIRYRIIGCMLPGSS